MKKTLREQIERIHTLTYGKKIVKEGFLDDLLGRKEKEVDEQTPPDDPASKIDNSKKADAVGKDEQGKNVADPKLLEDFYNTFEKAIDSGGLKQQSGGSMQYAKEVESMQIALVLLGYQLPQHGIDGLFGPETAASVQKFADDNKINLSSTGATTGETATTTGHTGTKTGKTVNETFYTVKQILENSQELRSTLSKLGYNEKGSEIANGGEISDELSSIVSKILTDFKASNPNIKITVTGGNDKFHQSLGYHSKHTEGQAVDMVIDPFNDQNANAFVALLDSYKSKDPKFSYIDEYRHPSGAATAGHFHLQYGEGKGVGGPSGSVGSSSSGSSSSGGGGSTSTTSDAGSVAGRIALGQLGASLNENATDHMVSATPEFLKALLEKVKGLNLTPEKLKEFIKKNVTSGGGGVIDVRDWQGIVNTVIDNLEGGYYHPDMLQDGRIKDGRYGNSGETMFGIDRKTGPESNTPAGQEFWRLIDAEDARSKWKPEYMLKDNPDLANKLRELVAQMMKPEFDQLSRRYLTPETADIVSKDPALTFHFAYATWNGSGWFQKFARVVNQAVASGTTDPKALLDIAMENRVSTGNSLMDQVGNKVAKLTSRMPSSSDSMA
jgi:peptidoglycan hydrolase-like protein with peptidoglycan-binding domain